MLRTESIFINEDSYGLRAFAVNIKTITPNYYYVEHLNMCVTKCVSELALENYTLGFITAHNNKVMVGELRGNNCERHLCAVLFTSRVMNSPH